MKPTPDKQPLKPNQIMENESSSVQEKSSVGLKPCPFCGGKPSFIRISGGVDEVSCDECFLDLTATDSTTVWETRPREQELEAALKIAMDLIKEVKPVGWCDWRDRADAFIQKTLSRDLPN